MLASTIWMYLVGAARYFMEGNVLERKALTRPWKVDLTQVERAWLRGQFLSVYRLQLPGRVIDLDLAPLKNGWPLVEAISSRIPPSAPEGPREYRGPRSALPLGVIGVIFLVGAVFFPDAIGKVACATFGFLIVGVAYCAYSKRYVTTPDGVWCQNWSGKRFVRFDDVKRLEVDAVAAKYGYLRRLRLEHGQGGVTITSQTEDLTLLEAYIRDHLRPDQIHDSLKKIGA